MPLIEGFKVENYRVLRQVTLGRLWNQEEREPLTPLVAVIGKNGVGKSTLFDAFGFLADCLAVGVEEACELRQRGGFKRLVSAGSTGPIRFEVHYRESTSECPITYELSIALDRLGRPYVHEERLRQRRQGQQSGPPHAFLMLREGRGYAWAGEESYGPGDTSELQEGSEDPQRVPVELADNRGLGIAALGALKGHPRIVRFCKLFRRHLNVQGDNLCNLFQYLKREYNDQFESLMEIPEPASFILIENPEKYLYHKLLLELVREFRAYATSGPRAPQIFITTHQPYLVDALAPEETWILEKGGDGFSSIHRAGDNPVVKSMVEQGVPLGGLWHGGYLELR